MAYSLTSHTGEHSPYVGKMLQSKFRKAFWKRRHFSGAEKAGYVVFSWTGRKEFLTKGKAKMKATQTSGRLVTQKQMYLRRSFRVSLYNERIILCNFMIQNFNSNTINWFFFFNPHGSKYTKTIFRQLQGYEQYMGEIYEKSFTFLTVLCRARPPATARAHQGEQGRKCRAFQPLRPAGQRALADNLRALPCKEKNKTKSNLGMQTFFENRNREKTLLIGLSQCPCNTLAQTPCLPAECNSPPPSSWLAAAAV